MANALCHWDFMVNDLAKSKQFYGRIFDWRFEDNDSSPGYTTIDTGGGVPGGMMTRTPGSPVVLNTYFQVDDITDTLRRVVEAGGNVIVPKTAIPPGWFAMFLDIDQIPVGIVQMAKTVVP